jgi:Holliday junction resolvase-like predicted endonuclease
MDPRAPRRIGLAAETIVVARLLRAGWRILGRNVRVGRLEIDIVAVDPGPPPRLVAVEVRYRSRSTFGSAEESFGPAKRRRILAAVMTIRSAGRLPDGTPVPMVSPTVDLVVVEPAPSPGTSWRVRHHRDALA